MHFGFDDDQIAFRDAVRDLLDKECTPATVRAAWDAPAGDLDRGVWDRLSEMGVLATLVPEAADGLGLDDHGREVLASCDVVIHSAATVSFDSPLDLAVEVEVAAIAGVEERIVFQNPRRGFDRRERGTARCHHRRSDGGKRCASAPSRRPGREPPPRRHALNRR